MQFAPKSYFFYRILTGATGSILSFILVYLLSNYGEQVLDVIFLMSVINLHSTSLSLGFKRNKNWIKHSNNNKPLFKLHCLLFSLLIIFLFIRFDSVFTIISVASFCFLICFCNISIGLTTFRYATLKNKYFDLIYVIYRNIVCMIAVVSYIKFDNIYYSLSVFAFFIPLVWLFTRYFDLDKNNEISMNGSTFEVPNISSLLIMSAVGYFEAGLEAMIILLSSFLEFEVVSMLMLLKIFAILIMPLSWFAPLFTRYALDKNLIDNKIYIAFCILYSAFFSFIFYLIIFLGHHIPFFKEMPTLTIGVIIANSITLLLVAINSKQMRIFEFYYSDLIVASSYFLFFCLRIGSFWLLTAFDLRNAIIYSILLSELFFFFISKNKYKSLYTR